MASTQRESVPTTHIMSVDVEEHFQVEAFAASISRESWDTYPSRVLTNTRRVLDLFEQYQTKATFFFLGWVADRFPQLVREVQARGHELACHSFWHRPVYQLTPAEFRRDTRMALDAIQEASGERVVGYRAPTWSITKKCLWAIDILAEEGFIYDSSIYPIRHDLYGMPDANRFAHSRRCRGGRSLIEIPPATVRLAGVNFPAAGGGYLRIFPLAYTWWAIRRIEKKDGQPVMVYFHPWELDPLQPRFREQLRSTFRTYTNLGVMRERVASLLSHRSFSPVGPSLANASQRPDHGLRGELANASILLKEGGGQ